MQLFGHCLLKAVVRVYHCALRIEALVLVLVLVLEVLETRKLAIGGTCSAPARGQGIKFCSEDACTYSLVLSKWMS